MDKKAYAIRLLRTAVKELKRKKGFPSVALFMNANDQVVAHNIDVQMNPFVKMAMANELRTIAREFSANCVFLVSDTFTSKPERGLRPSLDPDRKEAVMVSCEYIGGSFCLLQNYKRTSNNTIRLTAKVIRFNDATGILTGVLDPPAGIEDEAISAAA